MDQIKKDYPWLQNDDPYPWAIYEGWNHLINQLLSDRHRNAKASLRCSHRAPDQGEVRRLAILLFALRNAPEALGQSIQELYHRAENLSWVTCEDCGESGSLRVFDGCYLVRCDKHAPKSSQLAPWIKRQ